MKFPKIYAGDFFAKIINAQSRLITVSKMLHRRYLTGFKILLCILLHFISIYQSKSRDCSHVKIVSLAMSYSIIKYWNISCLPYRFYLVSFVDLKQFVDWQELQLAEWWFTQIHNSQTGRVALYNSQILWFITHLLAIFRFAF